MLLLVPTPARHGPTYEARTADTFRWLGANSGLLIAGGAEPSIETLDGWDAYTSRMGELWRSGGTWAILEHDIVPGDPVAYLAFLNCPEEFCFAPYEMHTAYFPRRPYYAERTCSFGECRALPCAHTVAPNYPVIAKPSDEWAAQTGIGCIRFRPSLTRKARWNYPAGNADPDGRLFTMLRRDGIRHRVHLHWIGTEAGSLLRHNHPQCTGDI